MKFGQLIDYNVRNIFLKKPYTKCDGETSLRPFYFSCMSKLRPIEIYWIEAARPPALTSYKAFLKSKKRSGTSLSVSFSAWFLKKNIFLVILTGRISLFGCLYFARYWAICVLQLFVNQAVTSEILKLTLTF